MEVGSGSDGDVAAKLLFTSSFSFFPALNFGTFTAGMSMI